MDADEIKTMHQEVRKILIIEDEFPMRYLIEYQLKQNGYKVSLAKDGADGLKAMSLDRPDLVLLDVMMPGMDGFEVCQQIKSNPETADIPVIFVTASEVHEYRLRAFDVGAAEYVTKPFRPHELVQQITAVLDRQGAIYDESQTDTAVPQEPQMHGQIVSLFSLKGGVGVTTLTIQLAEAIAAQTQRPCVIIDLDLPLGGVAAMLRLFPRHDIIELLNIPAAYITLSTIDEFTLRYRDNIFIIPAPGRLIDPTICPDMKTFKHVSQILTDEGYNVLIDAGSHINQYVVQALADSKVILAVTSGQPLANQQLNTFLESADRLGLDPRHILPVINEANGPVREITLARVPAARIPYTGETSNTKLWLREQGLRKLVALLH
jgi:CheY-like chemotaxis protein/MinD-like ATPase involved in chromosome partitioning or flagellar assembly